LVDAKTYDVARPDVGDQQELTGWIDIEVARRLALAGLEPDQSMPTGVLIDAERRNAVVAAIGAIQESPGRMNHDLGSRDVAHEFLGSRTDSSDDPHGRSFGIVAESGDSRIYFIDDIDEAVAGVDGQVTGPGTRAQLDERVRARVQTTRHFVQV